eukprot:5477561-Pyramimonas_sp.AAC.2
MVTVYGMVCGKHDVSADLVVREELTQRTSRAPPNGNGFSRGVATRSPRKVHRDVEQSVVIIHSGAKVPLQGHTPLYLGWSTFPL